MTSPTIVETVMNRSDVQMSFKILKRHSEVLLVERTAPHSTKGIPSKLLGQVESLTNEVDEALAYAREHHNPDVPETVYDNDCPWDDLPGSQALWAALRRAEELTNGLCDVLNVHFRNTEFDLNFEKVFALSVKWYKLAIQDRLEDYYKYQSCYLLSRVLRQDQLISELPKRPTWMVDRDGYIFGGAFYRYCRRCMLLPLTEDVIAQFYALTNVKRAGLAISEQKVNAAFVEHKSAMKGSEYKPTNLYHKVYDPKDDAYVRVDEKKPSTVLSMVRTKLRKLIKLVYGNSHRPNFTYKVPSVSASYESGSSKGGAGNGVSEILGYENFSFWVKIKDFIGFPEIRKSKKWFDPSYFPLYAEVDPNFVTEDLYDAVKYRMWDLEPIYCKISSVLEPFKCRTITVGESIPYTLGRCLQPKLHHDLRDFTVNGHQPFGLIGRWADESFIDKSYFGRPLNDNEFYVAGDFSKATDGMHPSLCLDFVDYYSFVVGLLPREREIFRACMNGHMIEYPDGDLIYQEHGQLMGSPLSFPILCLANAAVNWVSYEIFYGGKVGLKFWLEQSRALFNGDDTSFVSSPEHYGIWKKVAGSCGLNSSLGKSYCHKDFVMINSCIFYKRDVGFKRTFVLNPGLIKGQAKVLEDSRKDNGYTIAVKYQKYRSYTGMSSAVDQLEELLDGANEEQKNLVTEIFYHYMVPRLKLSDRPWSLPRHFGGLGLAIGNLTPMNNLMSRLCLEDPKVCSRVKSVDKKKPAYLVHCEDVVSKIRDDFLRYNPTRHVATTRMATDVESYKINLDSRPSLEKYFWGFSIVTEGEEVYTSLVTRYKSRLNRLKPWSDSRLEREKMKRFQKETIIGLPWSSQDSGETTFLPLAEYDQSTD